MNRQTSTNDERKNFYEEFAEEFDSQMNRYEVEKRLELVFDQLLGGRDLRDATFLDGGCGTGLFSQAAVGRGARVTSLDVGEKLLAQVAKKCDSERVVGSITHLPFEDRSFDYVMSTEVVEHTDDPERAVRELSRVVADGGTLVLTTPNRVWHPAIRAAGALKLRPYHGLENWISWRNLRRWVADEGLEVRTQVGFNALPFVHPRLYGMNDRLDRFGGSIPGRFMINMAIVAERSTRP